MRPYQIVFSFEITLIYTQVPLLNTMSFSTVFNHNKIFLNFCLWFKSYTCIDSRSKRRWRRKKKHFWRGLYPVSFCKKRAIPHNPVNTVHGTIRSTPVWLRPPYTWESLSILSEQQRVLLWFLSCLSDSISICIFPMPNLWHTTINAWVI